MMYITLLYPIFKESFNSLKRKLEETGEREESVNKRLREIRERMGEILQCPVCLSVPNCEIIQCRNGHITCQACANRTPTCPMCREQFPSARYVEKVAIYP